MMIEFEDHTDENRAALLAYLSGAAQTANRAEWGAIVISVLGLAVQVGCIAAWIATTLR